MSFGVPSAFGPLLPFRHVRCEVGSLSKTGPLVLDPILSALDPEHNTELGSILARIFVTIAPLLAW
jgi:hypothetical protein